MHVVTSVLREKSGEDGDGNPLVGKALGGDNPKIRLNSLQTDTEKNIQRGYEGILRGMYSAIRNPRSHESGVSDKREHADAIICFIDYLLTILDASRQAFSTDSFMERVTDSDYVDSKRYSELLVSEVPTGRIGDILIAIYNERRRLPLQKRRTLIDALLAAASESQVGSLLAVISNQLRETNEAVDMRTTIQFLPPQLWPKLAEPARLRIENKLIAGIRNGRVPADGPSTEPLATWAGKFLKFFTLREDATNAILTKLYSADDASRHYAADYFFGELPDLFVTEKEMARVIPAITRAIKRGDKIIRRALLQWIDIFPEPWQKQIAQTLAELTDKDNPAHWLPDGTPLLTADQESDFNDDIPF